MSATADGRAARPRVVAVGGGSGAGKTTLVSALAEALGGRTAVVSHDWYYLDRSHLPAGRRERVNYDHPRALDTALLVTHLRELKAGRAVEPPTYDFRGHRRSAKRRRIAAKSVIIVEGILVLQDARVRSLVDVAVFVDCPTRTRLARRLQRDAVQRGRTRESVLQQWRQTVMPMHRRFVEPSRRHADLVVAGESPADVARAVSRILGCLSALESR